MSPTSIRDIQVDATALNEGVMLDTHPAKLVNGGGHASSNEVPVVATVNGHTNDTARAKGVVDINIPLQQHPAYAARKLKVITVGAGFSGMILAHKLRYEHPEVGEIVDHTIYESRAEVGGTWLVNTYPGVQCDVPAHIYAFPFDPNTEWDRFYATGEQIQDYFVRTVRKWDLDRDVQLSTKVVGLQWLEEKSQWRVTTEYQNSTREELADLVISAQGFLNAWNWPDIPGLHDFKGHKTHSASWDHDFTYAGKRIAVIGNGSSGIQILPVMASLPGTQVTSFQRGPTWVVSRMDPGRLLGKADAGDNPQYSVEEKRRFRLDPAHHNTYRKQLVHRTNQAFGMFVKGSPENLDSEQAARKQMADKLNNDPVLCEKLIPKWELGCRRVTPGQGYLESFLLPNVSITQSSIKRITKNSIVTEDGQEQEFDVIVCATGFDVSHCPSYPVIGRNDVSLAQKWADEPESYMSLACADMPNYFIFTGPNAVIGHGSLVEGLGWAAEYIIMWFDKMAREDIKSVIVKQESVDQFTRYGDQIHKTLTWTGACRSWYKKNRVDGRVTAAFAGSSLLFRRMTRSIRGEDFNLTYRTANKFAFMGNGFTEMELDPANDLSWYVKH